MAFLPQMPEDLELSPIGFLSLVPRTVARTGRQRVLAGGGQYPEDRLASESLPGQAGRQDLPAAYACIHTPSESPQVRYQLSGFFRNPSSRFSKKRK